MEDYKNDIISTRKGCLGGSDAKMLQGIAELGKVPNSAVKRLAVCKGLIEHHSFTNAAMRYGDFIENCVYQNLRNTNDKWQSNPCLVSEKYSRENVKCIDHVDFMLQEDDTRTLTIADEVDIRADTEGVFRAVKPPLFAWRGTCKETWRVSPENPPVPLQYRRR